MQAVVIISVPRLEWPGEWPLFELDSNKRLGAKMRPLFELPLITVEVRPGALGLILNPPGGHC